MQEVDPTNRKNYRGRAEAMSDRESTYRLREEWSALNERDSEASAAPRGRYRIHRGAVLRDGGIPARPAPRPDGDEHPAEPRRGRPRVSRRHGSEAGAGDRTSTGAHGRRRLSPSEPASPSGPRWPSSSEIV